MQKLDTQNSIGVALWLASKSLENAFDSELRLKHGVSGAQTRVIGTLTFQDGLTQREIAQKLFIDATTLVPIIDKMEKNGFVERRADPKDRRNNRIFLTKKSEAIGNSIIDSIVRLRKIAYKDISKNDLDNTKYVLNKITQNVGAYTSKTKNSNKKMS